MSYRIELYSAINRGRRTGYRAFHVDDNNQQTALVHDSGPIYNDHVHARVAASKRGYLDAPMRGPNINPKRNGGFGKWAQISDGSTTATKIKPIPSKPAVKAPTRKAA